MRREWDERCGRPSPRYGSGAATAARWSLTAFGCPIACRRRWMTAGCAVAGADQHPRGANGRRILDSLREWYAPERILAGVSRQMQSMCDDLRRAARPCALWCLARRLDDFNVATARLAGWDVRPEAVLATAKSR